MEISNPSDTDDDHLLGLLKEIVRHSVTFFFNFAFDGVCLVKYRNSLQMNSYLSHILKVLDQIILLYLLENLSDNFCLCTSGKSCLLPGVEVCILTVCESLHAAWLGEVGVGGPSVQ